MIDLADIVRLAERRLNVDDDTADERYTFRRVHGNEVGKDLLSIFDFRLGHDRFRNAQFSVMLVDKARNAVAGNASILLVGREAFGDVTFWRRHARRRAWTKIALADLPHAARVFRIVMHGFARSPSFVQTDVSPTAYESFIRRYVRFVMALAALCKERSVPMLVEPTGRLSLGSRAAKRCLAEEELSSEERDAVGCTRPASIAAEKMARVLGLKRIEDVFNVRTMGSVFLSVPGERNGSARAPR